MACKPTARIAYSILLLLCAYAAILPAFSSAPDPSRKSPPFPGWPQTWEGLPLKELSLTSREASFADNLPGRVARFTDGHHEIIIRWWNRVEPSSRLHGAADCMQCAGYDITQTGVFVDTNGMHWSSFRAQSLAGTLLVRERIWDSDGRSWPEVSAWMWSVVCGRTKGPWWCASVSEPSPAANSSQRTTD